MCSGKRQNPGRAAGEAPRDCWASVGLEWNWSVGGGVPAWGPPERASCAQLVATGAQMFPEAKGRAVRVFAVVGDHQF